MVSPPGNKDGGFLGEGEGYMYILTTKYASQKGMLGGSAEVMTVMTAILVIVGIVTGIAYGFYKWAFATSEWQALDGLVTATRRVYQGEVYPANGIASQLITSQVTGNLRISSGNILNSYGTAYAITGNGGTFSISDASIPQSDCISILKQIPSTGYTSVSVNAGSSVTSFPVGVSDATTACNVSDSSGNTVLVTAQ
jgi:hypothetical protein